MMMIEMRRVDRCVSKRYSLGMKAEKVIWERKEASAMVHEHETR